MAMNNDSRRLMEVLGPVISRLFLTVTIMFVTMPYALERHPFDDAPRQGARMETLHPT
jgi:hypothetical protein